MPLQWNVQPLPKESDEGVKPPLLEQLLALRGIVSKEDQELFLTPDYERDLHDPFLFSAMAFVMERLRQAREKNEIVGIFGDFDADGITSSVLIREGLSLVGIAVSVYIPDKHTEGHGLSEKAIDFFESQGVSLIFTVDCGMMNHGEIILAKSRHMEVIVIDHHHVPEILPEAVAIINPKIPGESYPFKELCGAGTTFKVVQAIYETFAPEKKQELKWLLDVAAVGTVADVMPLVGENRVIVSFGLIVLAKTRRVGFQEMFALGSMPIKEGRAPVARDIGFHIAPRINAASRMAHAKIAHDLLVESDPARARELALILESYNTDRRKVSESISTLVRNIALESSEKNLIFAADPEFHFGVVGLVAGRIAHEFRKPVIVLTKGEEESRGSLRSIPEVNIIEAIEGCSDILVKFGGHAQAAGLTIRNEHLSEFERRLEKLVTEAIGDSDIEPEIAIDMLVSADELSLDFARKIRSFAPFGEGNQEPVFLLENMRVSDLRPVGAGGKHLKLRLTAPGGKVFDAIGFSLADAIPGLKTGEYIDAVFQVDENEWNGNVSLQLKLVDIRKAAERTGIAARV